VTSYSDRELSSDFLRLLRMYLIGTKEHVANPQCAHACTMRPKAAQATVLLLGFFWGVYAPKLPQEISKRHTSRRHSIAGSGFKTKMLSWCTPSLSLCAGDGPLTAGHYHTALRCPAPVGARDRGLRVAETISMCCRWRPKLLLTTSRF